MRPALKEPLTTQHPQAAPPRLDHVAHFRDNGLRIQSALYQVLNKEQAKLHRMLESFGLRPDARAKVTTAIRAQLQLFEVPKPSHPGDAPPQPPADPMSFSDF